MKKTVLFAEKVLFFVFLLFSVSLPLKAEVTCRIRPEVTYLFGYLYYQIGDMFTTPDGDIYIIPTLSKLQFPINTPLLGASIDVLFNDDTVLTPRLRANIPYVNGKMEDSDWATWYEYGYSWADSDSLDIFSTSDATPFVLLADCTLRFLAVSNQDMVLRMKTGIEYSFYYYEVKNTDQWYPSYEQYQAFMPSDYGLHYYYPGLSITYQVHKILGVVGLFSGWTGEEFEFRLGADGLLGAVLDTDDHVLRKKTAKGEITVYGIRGNFEFDWKLSGKWTFNSTLQGEFVTGSGDQTQNRYETTSEGGAGPIGTISEKWESAFLSLNIGFSYRF